MQSFTISRPGTLDAATAATAAPDRAFIAGGTDLLQLMKQEVARPTRLVDLDGLLPDAVEVRPDGVRIGALALMANVAAHPEVQRNYRAVSEALLSAASPQIRNMGTIGGNLLQRTRCNYFRDPGFAACNKREPGSGCAAIRGENRLLGVLGTSRACIATHPSDLPVALAALDASLELRGPNGARRTVALADFYRLPGDTPHIETALQPGEVIVAVLVPASAAARRSCYVKLRDRASFEFALVSCAAAVDLQRATIREARLALGGVAPKPWRLPQVEAALQGRPADAGTFADAAMHASEGAQPASQNGFKVKLIQRAVLRALETTAAA
ncbi:MAG: xanthine dehydrogenase family protein subunit M [Acetobacteraceae bacterium]|nr:xanthine dehydrogenase family protein subunit M [Acetobacteraceae bacterium]